jgi:3-isopropylmalate/(R)-2-methylmalate dehydratase large subunit
MNTSVFDAQRISLVMDHFAPNKDIKSAANCKLCRDFATEQGIEGFYDGGEMGIEHALLPELGLVTAGDVVIGADSHTCTYGALGAFSTGVVQPIWLRQWPSARPGSRCHKLSRLIAGTLQPWVSGKDVILTLIGMIGVDGALYQSLEFGGPGVASLTISDRLCICNMAIEPEPRTASSWWMMQRGFICRSMELCRLG